jgi:protein SCO1/2
VTRSRTFQFGLILAVGWACTALASAQMYPGNGMGTMSMPPPTQRPPMLQQVAIEQRLDAQIPPDLAFRDETGKAVRLKDYFGKKPIVLNLVYYNCPMLCGEVLSGLTGALSLVSFDIGKEYDVITVSFDPRETPAMAAEKKHTFLQRYRRAGADKGWHFLTGDEVNITALTKAAGFDYQYDPKTGQYAHATAIMILTPEGRISRYFYGVEFPPKDLRLGLVEASQNKIGSAVDQLLLYCYHYDPATGKYGAIVSNVLRLAAIVTMAILGAFLFVMFRRGPQTATPATFGFTNDQRRTANN